MKRWKPWALAAGLAAGASMAVAQSPADAVVQQLRGQGYVEFAVSWTLLGRIRILAVTPSGEQREIVFNPTTGEILRDYSEAADGSGAAPRVLSRPEDEGQPQAASTPTAGGGKDGGTPEPDSGDDGNHGHGNDPGGFDGDNPGLGHGDDGEPGRSGDHDEDSGNGNRGSGSGKGPKNG